MAWYEMALWPFQLSFMVQAMVIAVLVAVPTALLSCFLVLKGWSLMGDAIAHAVLPGVVLAYMVGLPIGIGAFIAGMVCALSVGFLKEHSRIKEDTVMGVVFAGLFGLGIVLYTAITTDVHLDHILFGNMLGVNGADILLAIIIALAVMLVVGAKWRDLMLFIFDAQQAGAIGLNTRLLHYGLLAMISLTIVGALQAVGMILVIALLIAPGAIAFLITRRFGVMLLVAMGVSVGCSLAGVYLSFFLDSAPAPTIVLLMSACFILAFITTQRRRVAAV
ncbi:manganese/iron transport system permease protein [Devosia subaequoris]|uniref:Manganese/iron transport system permease protein n=2 Tax=Devosia subaequoris TaxID=395930 RepID=A0A7W6IM70_9HYPH|nr:metal ABC transporter permease [Devosia subaequoris]MBB4052185.1 manganese/iron transport system permease protein [Devosia subaequoris]MCP1209348.1 metal ABC transporter permease [Devosia subaequoris]